MDTPQTPDATPARGSKGCLYAIFVSAAIVAVLFVAIKSARQQAAADMERRQQERREKAVQTVLDGRTDVSVSDGELLTMLADNPQCANSITSIHFFMADVGGPEFARLDEFPSLTDVGFYDCSNADSLMPAASTLPQLESLFFEVTLLSDDSLELLAKFQRLKKVHFEQVMDDKTIAKLNELLPNVNVETPFPASQEPTR